MIWAGSHVIVRELPEHMEAPDRRSSLHQSPCKAVALWGRPHLLTLGSQFRLEMLCYNICYVDVA
jgi:hypothetical protein